MNRNRYRFIIYLWNSLSEYRLCVVSVAKMIKQAKKFETKRRLKSIPKKQCNLHSMQIIVILTCSRPLCRI